MLQKEAEVLFPTLKAFSFSCYNVPVRILYQGCFDSRAIAGLAQHIEDTAHVVVTGHSLEVLSFCLPKLLPVLSYGHIALMVQLPILHQVASESGLTLAFSDFECLL